MCRQVQDVAHRAERPVGVYVVVVQERVVDRKFDPLTFLGSVIRRRKGD